MRYTVTLIAPKQHDNPKVKAGHTVEFDSANATAEFIADAVKEWDSQEFMLTVTSTPAVMAANS